MKKSIIIFIISIIVFINSSHSQVTPNSNRFDVENYIAIDNNGKYYPYTAHGFYENAATGATARIFLLPILKLDLNKIKFIDKQGRETTQADENIRSMIIPVNQDLALPNESQKAAIDAAINGHTTIHAFYTPVVRNTSGLPLMNPLLNTNPMLSNQIITMANNYEANAVTPQQQLINDYNTRYRAQIISLTELEIIVEAGSDVIYNKRIPNTSWLTTGGMLTKIAIDNPTEYVKNLIAGGNSQILVSYKFKDSKSSTINAHIDATAVVEQFLSEAYQSSVSQRSSGWSFLGLGSSKKSVKTSFDQQISQQSNSNSIANTTIEMYDADDQMIKEFEDTFFPSLSQQQAIQNHITAAEKARAEGNVSLQELHLKYVEALQNNNPNLTPNIEAAVAALGKKDYVGFIANGVRWGSNSGQGSNSFRRVLNSSEITSMAQNWSQTKVISLQHSVTQPVTVSQEVKFKPSLGTIDVIPFQNNLQMYDGYNVSLENIRGVLIGPITIGGAFHKNNITPGTLMTKIGSYPVYSGQTVTDALNNYASGDKIYVTLIMPTNNVNINEEKRVQITLGSYPKTN